MRNKRLIFLWFWVNMLWLHYEMVTLNVFTSFIKKLQLTVSVAEKRKGDALEPPTAKTKRIEKQKCSDLIVLGLPWKCAEDDLRSHFSQFGELIMVQVRCPVKQLFPTSSRWLIFHSENMLQLLVKFSFIVQQQNMFFQLELAPMVLHHPYCICVWPLAYVSGADVQAHCSILSDLSQILPFSGPIQVALSFS